MMPWRLHQLPAVICRSRCQYRVLNSHSSLTSRSSSRFLAQTSNLSGIPCSQLLPTRLLLEYDHTTGCGISRPLSAEAASHGRNAQGQNKSKKLMRQPYSDGRGPQEGGTMDRDVSQQYSASKRYTTREIEVAEEDQETEDDADTFGTLSNANFFKESDTSVSSLDLDITEDDMDWKRERRRKQTPHWYASRMKKLVKKGKLVEAIDFLEERMLKLDYVQPIEYNYDVLIGACGRAGYTKKAFQLYNRMKERGLHPSSVTYTSLFNACSESPWPLTDGYERLKKLHQQLKEKDTQVNLITAHAMIKSYGKCGEIEGAFHIFHHLLSSGTVVTRSFASLLMACASNREAGLTYAIEAWRQMLARGLQPDGYCFNLLLRVVRDCGIGNPETAAKILLKPVVANDAHLLGTGRGKKGKGRGRGKTDQAKGAGLSKSKDGGAENTEMIQLPAALIGEVDQDVNLPKDVESPDMRNWEDPGKDLGDRESDHTYSTLAEDTDHRKNVDGDLDWQKSEVEDVRLGMDTVDGVGKSGRTIENKHWWQETGRAVEYPTVTVLEEVLPLDRSWRNEDVVITLPNLLDQNANFENVESLASIQTPSDRLWLIGGLEGVLQKMKDNGVKPDIKTLSLFTDLVPMTTRDEDKLLAVADELGVSLDVDFYNMIIHRRTKRGDLNKAKEVVSVMQERGFHPNLRTSANLAIGCVKTEDGLQLLEDIENSDLKPNQVVFGALMGAAFKARNYGYLVTLMQRMKETGVEPNKRIIELLEGAAAFNTSIKLKPSVQGQVDRFRGFYYKWLSKMEVAEEPHPWDAFTTQKKKVEEV